MNYRSQTLFTLAQAGAAGDLAARAELVMRRLAKPIYHLLQRGDMRAKIEVILRRRGPSATRNDVVVDFMTYLTEKRFTIFEDIFLRRKIHSLREAERVLVLGQQGKAGLALHRAMLDFMDRERRHERIHVRVPADKTTIYDPHDEGSAPKRSQDESAGVAAGTRPAFRDETLTPYTTRLNGSDLPLRRLRTMIDSIAEPPLRGCVMLLCMEVIRFESAAFAELGLCTPDFSVILDEITQARLDRDAERWKRIDTLHNHIELAQEKIDALERNETDSAKARDAIELLRRTQQQHRGEMEELFDRGVFRIGEGDLSRLFGIEVNQGRNMLKRAKRLLYTYLTGAMHE